MTIASPRWDYYAADLRTGQILMDLPLVGFSGEVNLLGNGPMDAGLPLAHLGDTQRRDLLDATIPGRRTVVGVRDGTVRGEWIIWSRSRRNNTDPVQLSGAEVLTYANRRIVQAWSWTQTEQLQIADNLLTTAFRGSDWPPGGGAVALTVAPWTASGQKRDRTYKAIDGTIGARLRELSEVDNGFDYVLTPTWSGGGSSALIVRTAQLSYPQAGGDFGMIMEMAGTGFQTPGGGGGNILDFRDEEDTTELASRTYAVGETTDDVTLTGVYHDQALTDAGYPFMERSYSYSTVKEQPTIDDYARALWIDAQSPASVVEIVALADVSPAIGEYSLGDIVTLILDPSINYPDGYQGQVRVLGWKFAPPSSGPATVTIKITRELSV